MAKLEAAKASVKGLKAVINGSRLQRDIKMSFERFGLTKGTWMAIRSLPAARALFDTLPSMEALSAIGTTDVAIKQTRVSTTAVVADWLDNTADGVSGFLDTALYHLKGLSTTIGEITDSFDEGAEIYVDAEVYALHADTRLTQIKNLYRALVTIGKIDPEGSKDDYKDDIDTTRSYLSTISGMCRMGYDDIPGPAGMYCVEELTRAPLISLGYDEDKLIQLGDDVTTLLLRAETLIVKQGKMLSDMLGRKSAEIRDRENEQEEAMGHVEISQEEVLEAASVMTEYMELLVCALDCTGHIALNTLNTMTVASGLTTS